MFNEKTNYLRLEDGRIINYNEMPTQIQEHVKMLDALRNDVMRKKYEHDVYQLALETKKKSIETMLETVYSQARDNAKPSNPEAVQGQPKKGRDRPKKESDS